MTQNNPYGRRKLPYPYSYLTTQEYNATDLDLSTLDTVNQTGLVAYVIEMTPQQVRQFSSALTAGADLIYPDEQINVIAPWLKARTMAICKQLAECIETSDAVEAALADLIEQSVIINQAIQALGNGAAPATQASSDDSLWGASLSLAKWVQNSIVDTAEGVIATAELFEAVAVAVGITGVGDILIDNVIDFVGNVIATGAPQIVGEADTASLETLACYIFNRIRCFENNTYNFDALKDNLNDLALGLGTLKPNYYAALIAFFNLNAPTAFYRYWRIGLDDPDNDWSLLCDPCGNLCTDYDFTINEQGWYTEGTVTAVYNAGLGWSHDNTGQQSRLAIIINSPGQITIETITVTLSQPMNGSLRDAQLYIGNTLNLYDTISVGGNTQFTFTVNTNATRFQVYLRNDASSTGLPVPGYVTSAQVCKAP